MEYFYVTKLENLKLELFESKEHYLAFRQAWKDYINSGKHKPEWFEITFTFNRRTYTNKIKHSNLTGVQHLLFSLLTEKDLRVTFKPSFNKEGKNGLRCALYELIRILYCADEIHNFSGTGDLPPAYNREAYNKRHERQLEYVEKFLEPFGDAVTIEMLAKIHNKYFHSPKTKKHYFLVNVDPEVAREKDQAA